MVTNDWWLSFSAHFDRDKGLDWGRLALNSFSEGTDINRVWLATSSYAAKQYPENFHERFGMLPPCYRVKDLPFYTVLTKPLSMPHVSGVEGNFYQIFPFRVVTDQGGQRSDFGIHRDANAPGSRGCIVTTDDRFAELEQWLALLNKQGESEIPLFVQYS